MPNFLDNPLFAGPSQTDDERVVSSPFSHLHQAHQPPRPASGNAAQNYGTPYHGSRSEAAPRQPFSSRHAAVPQKSGHTVESSYPTAQISTQPKDWMTGVVVIPNIGSVSRKLDVFHKLQDRVILTHPRCRAEIKQSGNSSYLHLQAQDREELLACIQDCRTTANELLDVKVEASAAKRTGVIIRVEPVRDNGARVELQQIATAQGSIQNRPQLLESDAQLALRTPLSEAREKFRDSLAREIVDQVEDLKFCGVSWRLSIHLGQLILHTYKKGMNRSSVDEFTQVLQQPRTVATIVDEFGDAKMAKAILEAIREDSEGLFMPADAQLQAASEVVPQYSIEGNSPIHRVSAHLTPPATTNTQSGYRVSHIKRQELRQLPLVQLLVLRLGKDIDWKVVASPDSYVRGNSTSMLEKAVVVFDDDEIGTYPRLRHCPELKDFNVKTTYEFYWFNTTYLVELSINRRWVSAASCERFDKPITTISIIMRDESWDLDVEEATKLVGHVQDLAELVGEMMKE